MNTTAIALGRDSVEVVVSTQWARVLGSSPTSLDANFFEAGGNSFQAARLAGGLRAAVGMEVPLHAIFDHPTIRGQASWLRAAGEESPDNPSVMTLKSDGDDVPLVLLPGGGGSLVGLNAFGDPLFNRPVIGLLAPGLLPGESPARTAAELSAHFRGVLEKSGHPRRVHLAGFCGGGVFAFALACELLAADWEVVSVTMLDSTLAAPDITHDEIVRERLDELAQATGATELVGRASAVEIFEHLRGAGMDMLESDVAAFERRLNVFAALWRVIADFRPAVIPVPVRLYSLPSRDLPDATGGVRDWKDLGLPDFSQVDLAESEERLTNHRETLLLVEEWLSTTERARTGVSAS